MTHEVAHLDLDLMRAHVEALFVHDDAGQFVRVNVPGGAPAPRFFLGVTADGVVQRFRSDVDREIRRELEAASVAPAVGRNPTAPIDPEPYVSILGRAAPVSRTWTGPAFGFPRILPTSSNTIQISEADAPLLRPLLADWMGDVIECQPMVAVVVEEKAVALCCSVRKTAVAHEAGVETAREFRGRGFALQVVAEWARAVRTGRRVPLYSTSWTNHASLAVARKLCLVAFGSDLHVS